LDSTCLTQYRVSSCFFSLVAVVGISVLLVTHLVDIPQGPVGKNSTQKLLFWYIPLGRLGMVGRAISSAAVLSPRCNDLFPDQNVYPGQFCAQIDGRDYLRDCGFPKYRAVGTKGHGSAVLIVWWFFFCCSSPFKCRSPICRSRRKNPKQIFKLWLVQLLLFLRKLTAGISRCFFS